MITRDAEPESTMDNLAMAEFVYLLLQHEKSRVARSPAPHYPKPPRPGSLAPNVGDHGPSDSALLGPCARARATRRQAPSNGNEGRRGEDKESGQ
jgi:hypothetical protein